MIAATWSCGLLNGNSAVAVGHALMSTSKLLPDEPSLGLSALLCGEPFQSFAHIPRAGVGILRVEQSGMPGSTTADRR